MITSTKNPRIVEVRKLRQRKHRLRQNRFLVEGLQLLGMAMEARATAARPRIKPQRVFYSQSLFGGETAPRLLAQLVEAGAEATAVAPHVMNALSERDISQGLIATFALRELEWSLDELELMILSDAPVEENSSPHASPSSPLRISSPPHSPTSSPPGLLAPPLEENSSPPASALRRLPAPPPLLLILDQLQDPGNLGTLIRTADAVGARAVIILEPCVDLFDPKTVRGTMGSIFTVPLVRTKNIDRLLLDLSKIGYHLVGADPGRGRSAWHSDVLVGPVALALGNEPRGLRPELQSYLDDYVSLPLRSQVDSLNVAVAGGVLMYEWLRVNSER